MMVTTSISHPQHVHKDRRSIIDENVLVGFFI